MEGALAWSGNSWYDTSSAIVFLIALLYALSVTFRSKQNKSEKPWEKLFSDQHNVATPPSLSSVIGVRLIICVEVAFIAVGYLYGTIHISLPAGGAFTTTLLLIAILLGAYLIRILLYKLLGYVYLSNRRRITWDVSYQFIEHAAAILFFPVMVVSCVPSLVHSIPYLFLIALIIWRIGVIAISLKAFKEERRGSYAHFFLYLCSHELMPFILCALAFNELLIS